jgi:hypothetical protein
MTDTALHMAYRLAARLIAENQPMEHEIDELARGAAGFIDREVRKLMAQKRRAVWIEPRNGIKGQVIDSKCKMKPIDYVVRRKGNE